MPEALPRRSFAPRYPCPVCLGVQMEKTPVGAKGSQVVLDWCRRCGGIWFEAGEVQRVRSGREQDLWKRVARQKRPFRMQCHACHVPMDRNADACSVCGWRNRIDCPECRQPLETRTHQGLTLDVCRSCKGVWFDHAELAAIWTLSLSAAVERHRGEPGVTSDDGSDVLVAALLYSPDLVFYGAYAAGHVAGAGVEVLANAPEAAIGAAEVVGEAAGGVFDVILEIIGGIFDSFG